MSNHSTLEISGRTYSRPRLNGSAKLQDHHRARAAIVYVRQSNPHQVLENTESTELQYALVDRAVQLGWSKDRVEVILTVIPIPSAASISRSSVKMSSLLLSRLTCSGVHPSCSAASERFSPSSPIRFSILSRSCARSAALGDWAAMMESSNRMCQF